ncbi:MAG: F0F1 ATP synthase subunit delta, partial [Pseudomonadales bacterium]
MAELATLARPYARAVFDYAVTAGDMQAWSDMLAVLSAVAQQPKVEQLCGSPELTSEQQARAISNVCGDQLNDKGRNFVSLLAENGRLQLLPFVARLYEGFKAQREKTVNVEITSAFPLEYSTGEKLAASLQKKLDRTVSVATTVNSELLGGVIIRTGDMV